MHIPDQCCACWGGALPGLTVCAARERGCHDPQWSTWGARAEQAMPPRRKKKRKSKKKKGSAGGRTNVAQALLTPSCELAVLLGSSSALTRGDAVSGLWTYARDHGLNDGREMRCDAAMRNAFGVDKMTMFEVSRHLSAHLTSTGSSASATAPADQRLERQAKRPRVGPDRSCRPPESGAVAAARRPKPQGPVVCSALLTAVLCGGSGPMYARDQRQLTLPSVATVTARIQNYITAHALRVPRSNSVVSNAIAVDRHSVSTGLAPTCSVTLTLTNPFADSRCNTAVAWQFPGSRA
eukprot:COSAG02_NODE_224_length_28285_cov_39.533066_10_plen_295_part_00